MDVVPSLTRQVFSVLLVFLLLAAALWKARRGGLRIAPRGARSLEPIQRLALTPNHALHLIRVEGRNLLVATHPHGCTVLNEAGQTPSLGAGA